MHVDRVGFVHVNDAVQAIEIAEEDVLFRAYHELTHWHDPKKEFPEPGKTVLVKRVSRPYDVDVYDPITKRFLFATTVPMSVIAWRDIHEL